MAITSDRSVPTRLSNVVRPTELFEILNIQFEELRDNLNDAKSVAPILITGSPGVGKSSIVAEFCKRKNIGFKDVRLAQMEPADIRGLPVPNTVNHTMEWYVNSSWPNEERDGKFGILFLDELTSCDKSVSVAAYQLILDRCLGELYKLPSGWYIVAAGNLVTDRAVASVLSSALANRFLHVELQANFEDWKLWAIPNNIHPAVLGFLSWQPHKIFKMKDEALDQGWPSPRTWARTSNACYKKVSSNILKKMVCGNIGTGVGSEFLAFYTTSKKFDDILAIMRDPTKKFTLPNKPDELHAVCSALTYLLWRGDTPEETALRINGFFRITMQMPSDFATLAMNAAMIGNDPSSTEYSDLLAEHPMFEEWSAKHTANVTKHRTFKV